MFLGKCFTKKKEIHTPAWSEKHELYRRFPAHSLYFPSMSLLSTIQSDWLSVPTPYCAQLRENDLITRTELEQLVQTHTQMHTLAGCP